MRDSAEKTPHDCPKREKTARFDFSVYRHILGVRKAWLFDVGTLFMRMYGYMFTIGTISMLTLSGYSAFIAGTVTAVLSAATFLIGPRVAKAIDDHGQQRVVPIACTISLAGLIGLILTVLLQLPLPLCYVCAIIIAFFPSAQALARTRWTYLIRTGKFGTNGFDVRSAYSYEGVLEDAAFMLAPALNIALSAGIHPVAGMVFGGMCLCVGTFVLSLSKDTVPAVGWLPDVDGDGTGDPDPRFTSRDSLWVTHANRSVFSLSGTVRVLFVCMMFLGLVFGSFDSASVVYCQNLGQPTLTSVLMMFSGCISLVSGCLFGMMQFKSAPVKILLVTTALFGLGYATTALSFNAVSLFVFTAIGSPFYAPFYITLNTVCEHAVPSARLTESITWMNAGMTLGFAVGPTVAGALMDTLGGTSGYALVGVAGVLLPLTVLVFRRVMEREAA